MQFIFVTLAELNLLIPLISFKFLQSKNIPSMLLTLKVLKLDKSKYSNSSHSLNIAFIILTLSVLNLLSPIISFN